MAKLTPPISVAKVSTTLGVTSGDVGTLCTSNKINRASLRKPYAFGDAVTLLTADVLKASNCGMTPKTHKWDGTNILPLAWGQWRVPNGSNEWKRLTDFDGYFHNALPWLSNVRVWFTNPSDSTKPMASAHPSQGNWKHYCKAEFTINVEDNVSPAYMAALKDYCVTLIFASDDAGGGILSGDIYIQQTDKVNQFANGTYSLRVEIPYSMFSNEGYTGRTIAVLCLAPKYDATPAELDLTDLFSLDMFNDAALRAMCVKANEGIAQPVAPGVGKTRYISAEYISSGITEVMEETDAVNLAVAPMVVKLDTNDPDYISNFTPNGTLVICANGHFYKRKVTSFTRDTDGQISVDFCGGSDYLRLSYADLRAALGVAEGTSVNTLIGFYVSGSKIAYDRDPVTQWVLNWHNSNNTIPDNDWDIWHEWMNETGISQNGVGSEITLVTFNL